VKVALLAAALWLAPARSVPAPAPAAPTTEVSSFTLANGLEVVLAPRGNAQVVSLQLLYRVGARDEVPAGKRGIAHLFEHMMYMGSSHVQSGQHARLIERAGGTTTAQTSEDFTLYADEVPRGALDLALALEADRMRNLDISAASVRAARELSDAEWQQRFAQSPTGRAAVLVRALAFPGHPYAAMPLADDVRAITAEDCRAFYDRYYQPGNALLVLAGDVDETAARAAVERTLGAIPGGAAAPRTKPPAVTVTAAERREAMPHTMAGAAAVLAFGYGMPPASSPDWPALELWGQVVYGGASARLSAPRTATSAEAYRKAAAVLWRFEGGGMLLVLDRYSPGVVAGPDLAKSYRALTEPITARELEAARAELVLAEWHDLATASGLATALAHARGQKVANWQRPEHRIAAYRSVTLADVNRVARTYIARDRAVVLYFEPERTR
jgi:zinc protease